MPGEPLHCEATAQSMANTATGILHASAGFFGPALIHLATAAGQQAYCQGRGEDCNPDEQHLWYEY